MTKALVKTQIRLQQLVTKCESGQGTLEYVGMIIVASLMVVGIVAAAKGAGLGKKMQDAITAIVGS